MGAAFRKIRTLDDDNYNKPNNLLMFISFASPKETNQRKREKKRCSLPHIAQRRPFFQAGAFFMLQKQQSQQ